jgi:hypothetical protein
VWIGRKRENTAIRHEALRRDHLVDRVVFCLVEEPPAVRRTVVTSSGSSGRPFNAVSFSLLIGWPVAFSTTIVISSSAANRLSSPHYRSAIRTMRRRTPFFLR